MSRIVAMVVARNTSSRLPGKAMADLLGRPVVSRILERLDATSLFDEVAVATSVNIGDDPIAEYCSKAGWRCFRGHPENVLNRIYKAAENFEADKIVEVGGDCPFVDRDLLERGLREWDASGADLVSNALLPPFTFPVGYDFIGVTTAALRTANEMVRRQSQMRQPFQFFLRNSQLFKIHSFSSTEEDLSNWRWTLDYPEDLSFVRAVFESLYAKNPNFGFGEIKSLLKEQPEIVTLNLCHVDPPGKHVAWHTGSYHQELILDLNELIDEASALEQLKDYQRLKSIYEDGEKILAELKERAIYLEGSC